VCAIKLRLTLITEIIAPYRIPVCNELAACEDVELYVIFLSENDASLRQWVVYKNEIRFPYEVLPSLRRRLGEQNLLINWGVANALAASRLQVILCGGYNYACSWRAPYWAKRHRVPFLLWTESTVADSRTDNSLVDALKRHCFRVCRGFVVPGLAFPHYVSAFGIPDIQIFIA
jgi:hypothetical protein